MIFKRVVQGRITTLWMLVSLFIVFLLPIMIGVALYLKAIPILRSENVFSLLFSSEWSPSEGEFGFRYFVSSSLSVTILSFLFSAPVCLFAGIYLSQFASAKLVRLMHPVIDILAGLPSVIYGVWGVLIVVPLVAKLAHTFFGISISGYSILSGGIVLAIMCIPYMLNMLIEVFHTIPVGLKEAALSMGATPWETVKHVVLRKGFPGIISAYGLGLAKAFGETLAVMMVVGNMLGPTLNPLKPGYPLPALIANNYGEMMSIPMYDSALMLAAFILLIVILLINLFFRYFIYKSTSG